MINIRVSAIISGAAFVLSMFICLFSHTSMPMLIVRPLIFAVLFFVISALVNIVVIRFLPELLENGDSAPDLGRMSGSRINIVEEDTPPASAQAFAAAQADDTDEGLGNISDLADKGAFPSPPDENPRAGMDQNAKDGYTDTEEAPEFAGSSQREENSPQEQAFPWEPMPAMDVLSTNAEKSGGSAPQAQAAAKAQAALPAGIPDSVDVLPDLESMAGAFLQATTDEDSDAIEYSVSTPSPKPSSSNKTPGWAGDFNAKEMAAGLRTVLNKEKEG